MTHFPLVYDIKSCSSVKLKWTEDTSVSPHKGQVHDVARRIKRAAEGIPADILISELAQGDLYQFAKINLP